MDNGNTTRNKEKNKNKKKTNTTFQIVIENFPKLKSDTKPQMQEG